MRLKSISLMCQRTGWGAGVVEVGEDSMLFFSKKAGARRQPCRAQAASVIPCEHFA